MTLWIATGNEKKKKEILALLDGFPVELKTLADLGKPFEVVEDKPDFTGNAIKKATELYQLTGDWCLADDSGLEVDDLNGEPGVYSARYAGEPSDDSRNNQKLLNAILSIEKPKAQFHCSIALAGPGGIFTSEGIIRGYLIHHLQGTTGFGYDPLFVPDGYSETFAQLGAEIKNKISHRAQALNQIKPILLNKLNPNRSEN